MNALARLEKAFQKKVVEVAMGSTFYPVIAKFCFD